MEPITVLGLVSNIVSLIDAASRAAKSCYEIYKHGASIRDLQLELISNELQKCYSELNSSLISDSRIPSLQSGVNLNELGEKCWSTAHALYRELESIRAKSGGRRETVIKFIESKRKSGKIERLRRTLDEYQKTLDTLVLIDVRRIVTKLSSRQIKEGDKLNNTLKRLEASLASRCVDVAVDIKKAINKAIDAQTHQAELTRETITSHFDTTVQHQQSQQQSQQQRDLFLESLRFDDINLRSNEISQSHPETFGWIYDEENEKKHLWNDFNEWLRNGQKAYWINGKAGSGKSTLMKFIANDRRTRIALEQCSAGVECIILQFYFWLSGSKLQRSLKGLLCSVIRQALISDVAVLSSIFEQSPSTRLKRNLGDWSLGELKELLFCVVEKINGSKNVCFLLDGIDEFDKDEELQDLLTLIERLSELSQVKLCISSRPELYLERRLSQYNSLRLQDLTKADIEMCIRDRLEIMREDRLHQVFSCWEIDELVRQITQKADGVFLWVHYVLRNLGNGLRNQDEYSELLERIAELPSAMEDLYQQMWRKLNEDTRRYRKEASTYFSYHEFFPISLFEMLVIINDDVREQYSNETKAQDPLKLAQLCETLKRRIITRCAGLIEVVDEKGVSDRDVDKISSSHRKQCLRAKIKFFHRTAKDFLLDTKLGQTILGESAAASDARLEKVARARMGAMLQGIEDFKENCTAIMKMVGESNVESEIPILEDLRCVCETLSISQIPSRNINYVEFWGYRDVSNKLSDFATTAAFYGCSRYVRHFVCGENPQISSYYRGALFVALVGYLGLWRKCDQIDLKRMELANWLAQHGADLCTKQLFDRRVRSPIEFLLEGDLRLEKVTASDKIGDQIVKQTAQLVKDISWSALKRPGLVQLLIDPDRSSRVAGRLVSEVGRSNYRGFKLQIELEMECLCRLAMYHLADVGAQVDIPRRDDLKSTSPMRVLVYRIGKSVMTGDSQWYRAPIHEDSLYIGEPCEKLLFREEYPNISIETLQAEFFARLEEVSQRSVIIYCQDRERRTGAFVDLDYDAPVLDPSEEIDESNWREKGLFRYARS